MDWAAKLANWTSNLCAISLSFWSLDQSRIGLAVAVDATACLALKSSSSSASAAQCDDMSMSCVTVRGRLQRKTGVGGFGGESELS